MQNWSHNENTPFNSKYTISLICWPSFELDSILSVQSTLWCKVFCLRRWSFMSVIKLLLIFDQNVFSLLLFADHVRPLLTHSTRYLQVVDMF
jgi:hypothetical protein